MSRIRRIGAVLVGLSYAATLLGIGYSRLTASRKRVDFDIHVLLVGSSLLAGASIGWLLARMTKKGASAAMTAFAWSLVGVLLFHIQPQVNGNVVRDITGLVQAIVFSWIFGIFVRSVYHIVRSDEPDPQS